MKGKLMSRLWHRRRGRRHWSSSWKHSRTTNKKSIGRREKWVRLTNLFCSVWLPNFWRNLCNQSRIHLLRFWKISWKPRKAFLSICRLLKSQKHSLILWASSKLAGANKWNSTQWQALLAQSCRKRLSKWSLWKTILNTDSSFTIPTRNRWLLRRFEWISIDRKSVV